MAEIGELFEIRDELRVEWKMKDFFSLCDAVGAHYVSPHFHFLDISWLLWLHPNGETKSEDGYISLYLRRESSTSSAPASVILDYSLILKSTDREKDHVLKATSSLFDKNPIGKGFRKYTSRSKLMERKSDLLPSGDLTIICILKKITPSDFADRRLIARCDEENSMSSSSSKNNSHLNALSRDFSKLLDESSNYDVEIACESKIFKAHRTVLETRSTVFSAMLKSDMVEGKTGSIKVEDITSTIFEGFLRYLYSGTFSQLSVDAAKQYYEASDKYDVQELKVACSEFLNSNLSEDNACEILVLADQHSDENFRNNVISYIVEQNIPLRSKQWTDFCKKYPVLAIEVQNEYIQKHFPE